jgi:hypothetical protein
MSGGTFQGDQYRIIDIHETIESYINKQGKETGYGSTYETFEPEVVKRLEDAVKCLKMAYVYAQRVDYLLAGDDGQETFLERLESDLSKL